MFFDTHTHLDDQQFDSIRRELLTKLPAANIAPILAVAADRESCFSAIKLAEENDFILAAVGQHPATAQQMDEEQFAELRELAKHPRVKCIGEIGLDYHWPEDTDKEKQQKLEESSGITRTQYWQYQEATAGMTLKKEKLVAINSLDLTPEQKEQIAWKTATRFLGL